MFQNVVRPLILVALATLLVTAGVAGPAAATDHEEDEVEEGPQIDPGYDETLSFGDVVRDGFAGSSAAASGDRAAFLKAKKAFHEARQEIQAIKKGDESPVQDVPGFFDDDDDGED